MYLVEPQGGFGVGLGEWERGVWLCYVCDWSPSIPRPWNLMKLLLAVRLLILKGLRRISEETVGKERNSSDTMDSEGIKLRVETRGLNKLLGSNAGRKRHSLSLTFALVGSVGFIHRVTLNSNNPIPNVTWLLAFGVSRGTGTKSGGGSAMRIWKWGREHDG
ncbi:hypothetical protein K435DRAFT_89129 [Dendrothele bispora CBS 962.96]|uniref:Uncharacterized protein n=1 Tax=Dendrothele bispora (strain CBS 962.96) TaxID=1314807 RepID=A0A4S8KPC2_DENBC|nr:hypothetical protein K435DRAFT_89129 [Dendrothele bispora CBS 962.96]